MVSLFPTYDVFLYTARHPEPFPLVVLRAMAARMPVITTLEGSCADVIRKGENALVFRTGDPVDCAKRILEISANRTLSDEMSDRAYRELLDNYSALTVAGRVERLLNEIARARGSY
jgi:glycosyltransferase involved in cell wall biosynthesis